jgi:hypothetical protein
MKIVVRTSVFEKKKNPPGMKKRTGREVHDAPVVAKTLDGLAGDEDDGLEVDVKDFRVALLGQVRDGSALEDGRVVHDDIDATEMFDRGVKQPLKVVIFQQSLENRIPIWGSANQGKEARREKTYDNVLDLGDVGAHDDSLTALGGDEVGDLLGLELARVGGVVDHDPGAVLGEAEGNVATYTPRGARHEGDLAGERGGGGRGGAGADVGDGRHSCWLAVEARGRCGSWMHLVAAWETALSSRGLTSWLLRCR